MVYKIICSRLIILHYTLLDFIAERSLEVINCTTEEGQRRYLELFGVQKLEALLKRTSTPNLVFFFSKDFIISKTIAQRLLQQVNERARRLITGFLALSLTTRKKVSLSRFLGIDTKTMRRGILELVQSFSLAKNRVRRSGGGRKSKEHQYPGFSDKLERLTEDHLAGDPMSDKRWVRKNLTYFKQKLIQLGIKASCSTIRKYLRKRKIFLKSNKKTLSAQQHPDRDIQFQQIARLKKAFLKSGRPVISIDTKKKEKIGLFARAGRLWKKVADKVWDHDFPNLAKGKVVPFGIYDLKYNKGYVYCGTSSETPQFIVEMIVKWWKEIGRHLYPNQKNLLILCDAGGANGYRRHGWKYELQNQLAAVYQLKVTVCHYPPGASKWNPIEHRLFSFISINWAGQPLTSLEKMLELINTTTTKAGLTVQGYIVEHKYEKGKKYPPEQMSQFPIKPMQILPQWNYTLLPQ